MKKVFCVGEALIDMICTDKGMTLSEGSHFLKKTGGAPTNVAAAIAALGSQVDLMAKVGNDPFGDQLVAEMNSFGVGTRWMFRDKHRFTTVAYVSLMKNGERDFIFSRGADESLCKSEMEEFDISTYDVIHFGSATAFLEGPLRETYYFLLEMAKAHGKFVSFDPNYRHLLFKNSVEDFKKHCWYFIGQCDFFKVSDEEAMLLTQTENLDDSIESLKARTEAHFAVTLGGNGTAFSYYDKTVTIPSIQITPVDTTGAGDAFVGAVLHQLCISGKNDILSLDFDQWQNIIFNANKAGARTCEYMGAMEAFKHLNNQIFL